MTIKSSLLRAIVQLKKNNIKSFELDSEVLLGSVLKKDKSYIYSYPEIKLTGTQEKKFKKYIERRSGGEPVAYIVGHKEFYGLDFKVSGSVLIPRPETEDLLELVLKTIDKEKKQTIVDVGTGSGCIIVSLAHTLGNKNKYYGLDICMKALKVALFNAEKYNLAKIIQFKQSDLLESISNVKIDVIVANLPYVEDAHKDKLEESNTVGLKFEPNKALYAGHDGLDIYRRLFEQITTRKQKPKYVFCELGDKQATTFERMVKDILKSDVTIKKDLAGKDRLAQVKIY